MGFSIAARDASSPIDDWPDAGKAAIRKSSATFRKRSVVLGSGIRGSAGFAG
jgi:hypothetical protein